MYQYINHIDTCDFSTVLFIFKIRINTFYDILCCLVYTTLSLIIFRNKHYFLLTATLPGNRAAENLYRTRKYVIYARSAVGHTRSSHTAHSTPCVEHNTFAYYKSYQQHIYLTVCQREYNQGRGLYLVVETRLAPECMCMAIQATFATKH